MIQFNFLIEFIEVELSERNFTINFFDGRAHWRGVCNSNSTMSKEPRNLTQYLITLPDSTTPFYVIPHITHLTSSHHLILPLHCTPYTPHLISPLHSTLYTPHLISLPILPFHCTPYTTLLILSLHTHITSSYHSIHTSLQLTTPFHSLHTSPHLTTSSYHSIALHTHLISSHHYK